MRENGSGMGNREIDKESAYVGSKLRKRAF